ncbi:phospholipase D epsilon [Dorcoceras hygrometricum]|uniref:Phospholipase D epsilon n=1 Tax=Dorcoceras hygrometricum TaxID=472368 RepID=A0A2Z7CNP2_9LAMI|nr:phospholipase D epsilon [Dorcoceras hygrometricum]
MSNLEQEWDAQASPAQDIQVGTIRQSGPRPDPRLLRQTALEVLTRSARSDSPRKTRPEQIPAKLAAAATT